MVDSFFMQLALDEAWKYQGLTYPNPAVGAVVVKDGRILSIAAHKEAGAPHAEVLALKEAYYNLTQDSKILSITDASKLHSFLLERAKNLFKTATIYVTLEPCSHYGKTPSCALLLKQLKIKKIVISMFDPNKEASGGARILQNSGIEVEVGVLEEEGRVLLEPFVKWQRERFIFFKYAQTLNGSLEGSISSNLSREFVHKLRNKIDLLVIGGNTVRVDRPILDARLVEGRAPDILIYSRQKSFERSIPLFNVEGRKVYIDDSFDKIKNYRYIMIEGGEGMLKATKEMDLWYLLFISPDIGEVKNYQLQKSLAFLKVFKSGRDLMIWGRDG